MNNKPYHRTSNGWTDERRAKHSAAIRTWSPWKSSTGPRTADGKSISRCNALKHGATSRPAKDFMRHFQTYRQFLRTCWQHRNGLAEKLANQQNELLNVRRTASTSRRFSTPNLPQSTSAPSTLCKKFAFSSTYAYIAPHEYAP